MNLPFRAKMFGDLDFHREAQHLAGWVYGTVPDSVVRISKAPGPVLFYAVPYVVASANADDATLWKFGVGWNFLWLTMALILLKDTATLLFSKTAGLIAVALAFILPLPLYYGIGILAETLAFVGVTFFCYGTARLFEKNSADKIGIAAIIWGMVALASARPNSLILYGLVPLILLWLAFGRHKSEWAVLRSYWTAYAGSVLVMILMFIMIRQLPGYSQKTNQESYFVYVAHQGRFQFRMEPWDWRFWEDDIRADSRDYQAWRQSSGQLRAQMQQSGQPLQQVYGDWVWQDVMNNPGLIIQQFFIKTLFGHFLQISSVPSNNFKLGPLQGKTGYYLLIGSINVINLLILLSAIAGFIKYCKQKRFLLLIIAPWLALIIFHGLIYMEQRYLFPARPVILILASPMLAIILQTLKTKFTHAIRSLPGHSAV